MAMRIEGFFHRAARAVSIGALAFASARCGGAPDVKCKTNISLAPVGSESDARIHQGFNQALLGGIAQFTTTVTVETNGKPLSALDAEGKLTLRFVPAPQVLGADKEGVLAMANPLDGGFKACTTKVADCSPIANVKGALMPAVVSPTNKYGMRMKQTVDGTSFASEGQMIDRTFGEPVFVGNFAGNEIKFINVEIMDPNSGEQTLVSYRVNDFGSVVMPDGTPIADQIGKIAPTKEQAAKAAIKQLIQSLGKNLVFFHTNGSGKENEFVDSIDPVSGQPIPDPVFNQNVFVYRENDGYTLGQVYMGKTVKTKDGQDDTIRGLAIDDQGNPDFSSTQLSQYSVSASLASVSAIDNRTGTRYPVEFKVLPDGTVAVTVPPQMHADRVLDATFVATWKASTDNGVLQSFEYVNPQAVELNADNSAISGGCEQ